MGTLSPLALSRIHYKTCYQASIFTIILLILGLTLGTYRSAQAEPSLTLYGQVDTGIAWDHISNGDSRLGLLDSGLNDSLFGLQGHEQLHHGTYMRFQLEGSLALSSGQQEDTGRLFDYQSWLGIGNEQFGELRFGRLPNAGQELFSELGIASWADYDMGALLRASESYYVSNQIRWSSPETNGFQLGASYSFDVTEKNNDSGRTHLYSLGLLYEKGPWMVAASYDTLNNIKTQSPIGIQKNRPHAWQLGASYDFDFARISAAWSRQKNGFVGLKGEGPEDALPHNLSGLGPLEFVQGGQLDSYYIGAGIPLAHGELQLQWSLATPDWHWQDSNKKAKQIQVMSIGYTYPLSTCTNLYAFAAGAKHFDLDAVTRPDVPRHTQRVMLGVSHSF